VLNAFATGRKPVYRLTTRLGRTVRATANHQFLTVGGWRRLDELAPGMRLALPRQLPGPARATMRDEELALLGHLIGDGCTLARQPIHYTTVDPDLAEAVCALARAMFEEQVNPRICQERSWYQVYLTANYRLTHGKRNPIAAWLADLGVFNLRSHEKRVPERVFGQPASGVARFLRHLWATDGSIWLSSNSRYAPRMYYATSSPTLARHVQSLLLRQEINAAVLRSPQGAKGRDRYHVDVTGSPDQRRFIERIGAVSERKTRGLAAVQAHLLGRTANTNRDVIPRDEWKLLAVPAMQAVAITTRQMQAGLGHAYCGTGLYKQNLSRDRAARLSEVVHSDELARLARSDVYWDEIAAIVPDGEEEVYDLTVEGLHNFVAGDIVVHNSIEQDADMVVFIYREELYDPETEKKGIAELHIAKHRNGPMGVVNLRFFEKTTRFADLELYREPQY
jgi:replicative DNA helicase